MMRYLAGTRDPRLLALIYELSKQKNLRGSEAPELTLEEISQAIQTIPELFYTGAQFVDPEAIDAEFIRSDIEALTKRALIVLSKNRVQLTPFGMHVASTFRLPADITEALKTLQ